MLWLEWEVLHGFLQSSSNPTDKLAKEMTDDLEVNFNKSAPFRKEDTAKELKDGAVENATCCFPRVDSFACCHRQRVQHDCQVGNPSHRRAQRVAQLESCQHVIIDEARRGHDCGETLRTEVHHLKGEVALMV